jgi:transcriptional regulator with XRE-family HTH domain
MGSMAKRPDTLTDLLRALLADSVQREVCRATGLDSASVSRFATGKRSLRLDMADRLAAYYGVRFAVAGGRGKAAKQGGQARAAATGSSNTPRRTRRGSEGK